MNPDDQLSMPNRQTTTIINNAERVHSQLVNQAIARQHEQQQQASVLTRRERMYY